MEETRKCKNVILQSILLRRIIGLINILTYAIYAEPNVVKHVIKHYHFQNMIQMGELMKDIMIVESVERNKSRNANRNSMKRIEKINERKKGSETKKAYNKQNDIEVMCGCGSKCTKTQKARHETTKTKEERKSPCPTDGVRKKKFTTACLQLPAS